MTGRQGPPGTGCHTKSAGCRLQLLADSGNSPAEVETDNRRLDTEPAVCKPAVDPQVSHTLDMADLDLVQRM